MTKKIFCPNCHQEYDLEEELNGRKVECFACKHHFVVDFPDTEVSGDNHITADAAGVDGNSQDNSVSDDYVQKESQNESEESGFLKGKIAPESVNIYDDMASAAFDYLYEAACKIIAEEDSVQEKIDQTTEEIKKDEQQTESEKKKAVTCFIIAGLCVLLVFVPGLPWLAAAALIPLFMGISARGNIKKFGEKKIKDQESLENFRRDFINICRDYKINKLGVAYVPIATQVPFEGKSFLLDDTKHVGKKDFSLYKMNNQAEFITTINCLKQLQDSMPIVEKNDNCEEIQTSQLSHSLDSVHFFDYIGEADRNLRAAGYFLNDLSKTSVSLPIIDPHGKLSKFLDEFCTDSVGHQPVISVFPVRTYQKELEQFNEMNEVRKMMVKENEKFERMLRAFMKDIADYVQMMSRLKILSTNKIVDFSNAMLLSAFRASCNHYSSALEADEIQRLHEEEFNYHVNAADYEPFALHDASRVKFDPISKNWVGEDGGRTNHPFGIHQIQEEVIAPLSRNLLRENRLERLKIYNNIRDQKLDYLNQWHRDTDDFYGRGRQESSDIINLMQTSLTEFNTALSQYKAFEETEKSMMQSCNLSDAVVKSKGSTMAFSIAYCEEQTKQIRMQQDEFNNYIERLKEDIDRRAEEFDYTRFYDAYLQDGHSREYVQAMFGAENLSERQKNLLAAGEFIAENASLPPEPEVVESVFGLLGTDLNMEVAKALAELDEEHAVSFNDDADDSSNTDVLSDDDDSDEDFDDDDSDEDSDEDFDDEESFDDDSDEDSDEDFDDEDSDEDFDDDDSDEDFDDEDSFDEDSDDDEKNQ